MPAPTPRTTPALVRGIIDVDLSVDLSPFIAIANDMTTSVCGSSGYTDGYEGSKMELIERWLSAHFWQVHMLGLAGGPLTAMRAGSASAHFAHPMVQLGLGATIYGQTAIQLDTASSLARLINTQKIQRNITIDISWLGKPLCHVPTLTVEQ